MKDIHNTSMVYCISKSLSLRHLQDKYGLSYIEMILLEISQDNQQGISRLN